MASRPAFCSPPGPRDSAWEGSSLQGLNPILHVRQTRLDLAGGNHERLARRACILFRRFHGIADLVARVERRAMSENLAEGAERVGVHPQTNDVTVVMARIEAVVIMMVRRSGYRHRWGHVVAPGGSSMNHKGLGRLMLGLVAVAVGLSGALTALAGGNPWLDNAFGRDGTVATDFGGDVDHAYGVAAQPDGKIVAVGFTHDGERHRFAVARYDPNGLLDPSFGSGGLVVTAFGVSHADARAVEVAPDGKIIVAGFTDGGTTSFDGALARYLPDGSLDTTFGGDGRVVTDYAHTFDQFFDVTLQGDGKIVALGNAAVPAVGPDFFFARYNTDGSLDTTFGGDGKVIVDIAGSADYGRGVLIDDAGKINGAGAAWLGHDYDFALARLNPDGSPDATFGGGDGKLSRDIAGESDFAHDLLVQDNGRIVLGGYSGTPESTDFSLARFFAKGGNDNTFGDRGKVVTDLSPKDYGEAIKLVDDGDIVLVGSTITATNVISTVNMAVLRYNPNGSLDLSFAQDGVLIVDQGGDDQAYAVDTQVDGKYVVAGYADPGATGNDFGLTRVLPVRQPSIVYLPMVMKNGG